MAGDHRLETLAVAWLKRLESTPYRFGFYPAMRRLEAIFRDKPRIGYSARPRDEAVRVGQSPSLAFAPSTLASFRKTTNVPDGATDGATADSAGGAYRLQTYFFGMLGPNGALPLHLSEFVQERTLRHRDETLARFVDLFHHRFATLFYRAWADSQPTVQADRPESDRFATYIGSLIGIGIAPLRHRDAMPDATKLHFAGFLAARTRHAPGLRAILTSFLRAPVEFEQFVGHWMELPDDCRLRLGESRSTAELGRSIVLGRRMWDRRQTIGLKIGPLSYADYCRLLPGGDSLKRVEDVIKNYVGLTLRWHLRLVLKREEIPPLQLGRKGKLGWTSWLAPRRPQADPQELVLRSDARRFAG